MLFDILDYIIINYAHGEETPAVLKSAYPLDLEDVQRVKENLEKKFKRKVRLYLDLDGELLGGLQITMGNTVIDGSLKRRLEDLREKIKAARL
jgi:F-type H+-transporting ATPase subunit delta